MGGGHLGVGEISSHGPQGRCTLGLGMGVHEEGRGAVGHMSVKFAGDFRAILGSLVLAWGSLGGHLAATCGHFGVRWRSPGGQRGSLWTQKGALNSI